MIQRILFTPEHEAFRDSFRRFMDKEIAPFHADWEEQGFADRAVWHKAGVNRLPVPDVGIPEVITGAMGLGGK